MLARSHDKSAWRSGADGVQAYRPKVLVIDDEPTNINVLTEALKIDYELIIATDAQSALRLLERGDHPHVILLDVMMPEIDGFTFCRRIKQRPSLQHIPVIFVTSLTDAVSEEKGFAVGAVDYIYKPIRLTSVRARIRTHISLRGMLDHMIELNQQLNSRVRELDKLNWRLRQQQRQIGKAEESRNLFESVFMSTSEGIAIIDAQGLIVAVNHSFSRISGFEEAEVMGKDFRLLEGYAYNDAARKQIWRHIARHDFWTGEIYNRRKNGEVYPELRTVSVVRSATGKVSHYVTVFTDISGIRDTERRLEELTWRDPVTGLSNRAMFLDQLGAVVKYCHRGNITSAVLVLDINGFRAINDSHGYGTGDLVIREFAERLVAAVTEDDAVARLSGDEFALLLAPRRWTPDEAFGSAQALIKRLADAMAHTFTVDGLGALPVEITVGVSLFPNEASNAADVILQQAETAHHAAKVADQQVAFFEDSMSEEIRRQIKLESELLQAIDSEALLLFAQGQYTPDKQLTGYEILVRWQHPEQGLLGPGTFIPFAEKSRLIIKIERYIIRKTLEQHLKLQSASLSVGCSINVSARHFAEPDFVESVIELIRASEVDPASVTLELTESVMVTDVATVVSKMEQLSEFGCKLSLDDFGTGYSSLAHLRRLPISEIKIDRSFVLSAPTEVTAASIVEMVHIIGETMEARIVAEGIETHDHVAFFTRHYPGVDMQGYYFAKPRPVNDFIRETLAQAKV